MAQTGIVPTVDFVFKRLFATEENAGILIHFLNGVLQFPESKRIRRIEFVTPVQDRETEDDKLTVVDVRVRDQSDRLLIIEMQVIITKAFCERLLYYWAREYRDQLHSGEDYSLLQPTILVCVVVDSLFPTAKGAHHRLRVKSDDGALLLTDRLEIHTLELAKFQDSENQLENDLERWLYFLKNGEEIDPDAVPEEIDVPEIRQALEVLNVISQTERDRAEYEQRMKRQRDLINRDQLLVEGGIERGLSQGLKQGEIIGRIHQLEDLLGLPETPAEELTLLPMDALKQHAETLAAELRKRT